MAVLRIDTIVSPNGEVQIKKLKNSTDGLGRSAKSTEASLASMATKVAGIATVLYGTVQAAKAFIEITDSFKMVESRLKLVTNSMAEMETVQNRLFNISQNSRQEYGATSDLYTRLARSTKSLGTSQKDLLSVTETINKALIVSGASTQEASSAITQLGQGLASGVLRGEEFNSIMENGNRIALAMSDSLGVNLGQLRAMASEGKLTANVVVGALKNQADVVGREFDQMAQTVGQSFVQLENSVGMLASNMDKSLGVNSGLAKTISDFSTYLDENRADIIDFAEDIIAGGTIVANGLESIYLVAKIGYVKLALQFKSEIESVLNAIIIAFESSLNFITSEINQSTTFWNNALNLDIGNIDEVSLGRVTIETSDLNKAIEESNAKIQDLGKSTDAAFKELATSAEATVKAIESVKKSSSEINTKGTSQEAEDLSILNAQEKAKDIIRALELVTPEADKINDKFLGIYDLMEGIFDDSQMDNFFKKWNKELAGIEKEQKGYEGIGSKDWTAGLTGQAKDIANIGNAFADLGDEQKKWAKYSEENAVSEKDKAQHLDNQLGLYGNIAGAVSNMAEEGSTAAKVAQTAQAALAIVQGASAIVNAGTGDPYTAIPRMIAMAATVAQVLGNAGISGGGSISAVSGSQMQESKFTSELTEMTMQPMLDRLDRQIELLEIIGLEGTAGRARVTQAKTQYDFDIAQLAEEIIQSTQTISNNLYNKTQESFNWAWENQFKAVNESLGENGKELFSNANNQVTFNASVFRDNPLEAMGAVLEAGLISRLSSYQDAQKAGATTDEQIQAYQTAKGLSNINELQAVTHDYIISLSDVVESMSDAKDNFKEIYDDITNSSHYAKKDLKEAFSNVGQLTNGKGLAPYLAEQVNAITAIEKELSTDITELFLSQDVADIEAQVQALNLLNEKMTGTFIDGTEEALNFLDSIELVGEAMSERAELEDRLTRIGLDDSQLLAMDRAKELSETTDEYSASLLREIFAKEDALEVQESYVQNISSLEGVLGSLTGVIDKLKGVTLGSSYTMGQFYDSMDKAKSLFNTDDYEGYEKAINKAIGYSSVLFDEANFANKYDQKFNQNMALHQFQGMDVELNDEIDYLKRIAEATEKQLNVFENDFGSVIQGIYQSELGRPANNTDIAYWSNDLNSGQNIADVTNSINNSPEGYIYDLYAAVEGKTSTKGNVADISGMSYWLDSVNNGASLSDVTSSFQELFPDVTFVNGSHANGLDRVPFDGYVAQLHEGEGVATKGVNSMIPELLNEIKNLRKEVSGLKAIQKETAKSSSDTARNTRKSYVEKVSA